MINHVSLEVLEMALPSILESPKDEGVIEMIVRRPAVGEREVIEAATLDLEAGLVGDSWITRGSTSMADGSADPEVQLTLMNTRVIAAIAQSVERWPLAGDQLFVDLDLSAANLPPGTRLAVGSAVVEVTARPHTGCKSFSERFGVDALKFVNSPRWKELKLRGVNARVVQPGQVRTGDAVRKI